MNYLYPKEDDYKIKKSKDVYLYIGIAIALITLIGLLLIYFLHPRNKMWLYLGLSLVLFLLGVIGFYCFFFFKFEYLKSKQLLFLKIRESNEEDIFIFKENSHDVYSNKLSFSSYIFIDEKGNEHTFLILNESNISFSEGKKYLLCFSHDYLVGYKEISDEE